MTREHYVTGGANSTRATIDPPKCPPLGFCIPVRVDEVYDGDTCKVRLFNPTTGDTGAFVHSIRLLDCWCAEVRGDSRERGVAARDFAKGLIEKAQSITLWVPFEPHNVTFKVSDLFSMNRVLGRLFLDGVDMATLMVHAGFATSTKF